MLELTSKCRVSHLTGADKTGIFTMGFLRSFFATHSDLPCFINNNKIDSLKNQIFVEYKKLMVSYFSYN